MQIYQPTLPFYVIDNLLQGGNKKIPSMPKQGRE